RGPLLRPTRLWVCNLDHGDGRTLVPDIHRRSRGSPLTDLVIGDAAPTSGPSILPTACALTSGCSYAAAPRAPCRRYESPRAASRWGLQLSHALFPTQGLPSRTR